ncbi:MAG: nucleotide exchange factor GrpE, partial [Turicimonas muris]
IGMKDEYAVWLKFAANTMQAITMVKDPAVQPGCVAQVFQRGWKIADRVLRPAMVAVAQ